MNGNVVRPEPGASHTVRIRRLAITVYGKAEEGKRETRKHLVQLLTLSLKNRNSSQEGNTKRTRHFAAAQERAKAIIDRERKRRVTEWKRGGSYPSRKLKR